MILILCIIGAPILVLATPDIKANISDSCILPLYPDHGTYEVVGASASPGDSLDAAVLNVTCNGGYNIVGRNIIVCYKGIWSDPIPTCSRACKLNKHPSVEYQCFVRLPFGEGFEECEEYAMSGTVVKPVCRQPNYYHLEPLAFMHCIDGSWDYVATCTPECGRATGDLLPWHAFIYSKTYAPYKQICGGSLVKTDMVISAAHCFWSNTESRVMPASSFAVAVGKKYRPWGDLNDVASQKSDVLKIKVPSRFQGNAANYQDDIALVMLTTPVKFTVTVSPVCLNFDYSFEGTQLKGGNLGKIPNWTTSPLTVNMVPKLTTDTIAYIDSPQCIQEIPLNFREFVTSDKICAGNANGKGLCDAISGNGLTFSTTEAGVTRHYLRGLASTAPRREDTGCNHKTIILTRISMHEDFIKNNWSL